MLRSGFKTKTLLYIPVIFLPNTNTCPSAFGEGVLDGVPKLRERTGETCPHEVWVLSASNLRGVSLVI